MIIVLLGAYALIRRNTTWSDLWAAANLPFTVLVFVWAFIVILCTVALWAWTSLIW